VQHLERGGVRWRSHPAIVEARPDKTRRPVDNGMRQRREPTVPKPQSIDRCRSARTGQIVGYGGKCADVAGANSANGTAVQLCGCNGSGAQSWTVGADGRVRALGKCLVVAAADPANGTKVQIYGCNGTTVQQCAAGAGGSLWALGKCLDATGPSSVDGTRLQIWDCSGGANQSWQLPGVAPGSGPGSGHRGLTTRWGSSPSGSIRTRPRRVRRGRSGRRPGPRRRPGPAARGNPRRPAASWSDAGARR
jgi:hypothetical protein